MRKLTNILSATVLLTCCALTSVFAKETPLANNFLDLGNRQFIQGLKVPADVMYNPETLQQAIGINAARTEEKLIGVNLCHINFSPFGTLAPQLPFFDSATLTIDVTTTMPSSIRTLWLYSTDEMGHLIKISNDIDLTQAGNHVLQIPLKKTYPSTYQQYLGESADSKNREFPLTDIEGIYFESGDTPYQGMIYINDMTLTVDLPATKAIELGVETGTSMHVVFPTNNKKATATLQNILDATINCTVKLAMTDYKDTPMEWSYSQALTFAPGETKTVDVPVPEKFGVYNVIAEITADNVPANKKSVSFAYFKPTMTKKDPQFADRFLFGSVAHLEPYADTNYDLGIIADAMSIIGLDLLRTDFRFYFGKDITMAWFDKIISTFSSRGMNFDFIIDIRRKNRFTDVQETWSLFRRIFSTYKGKVRFWETLNEPDLDWGITNPLSSGGYVVLAHQTRWDLDEIDPSAKLMSAGFCNFGHPIMGQFQRDAMAACKDIFDIHCFHGHGSFDGFVNTIDKQLLPMREELGLTMPWFANETAITVGPGTTRANQAETLYKKLTFAWSRGSLGYIWYNLRTKGKSPDNSEFGYGMLTIELYPKPVYAAYNALIATYRDKKYDKQLDLGENNWGFVFQDEKETAVCLWTQSSATSVVSIPAETKTAEYVDMFGNKTPAAITDGTVKVTLTGEPVTLLLKK